ncbi:PucR family transcriptional regulator [Leucobacter albus]|uniref:PucR family transcriptional regulator n=1 Tax=Leucobacter albus TaxID=272210 RepID=A0ABW3TN32_9MICO
MQHTPQYLDRATVPLATLLDEPSLQATLASPSPEVLSADPRLAAQIRSTPVAAAIVIELEDPGPYMLPGDLLMVTGLAFSGDAEHDREYVSRLRASGVSAILFGLEPVHAQLPATLLQACQAENFPLIVLPPPIYFAAVTSIVNRALETERTRALEHMNTLARHLTEAVLQHRPAQRLVERLATEPGSWAALRIGDELYLGGDLPHGASFDPLFRELDERLRRPRGARGGAPTVFTTLSALPGGKTAGAGRVDYEIAAHAATPRGARSRGLEGRAILAIGRTPRLSRIDLTALQLAANLVGLLLQLPAAQSLAVDQLLMQLLMERHGSQIIGAERERFARLIGNALGGSGKTAHAVIAMRDPNFSAPGDPVPAGETVASDANWLRHLLHTPFVEHRARQLRAFVGSPPSAGDFQHARQLGWLLAVSRPQPFLELPTAMQEAEELARAALHIGDHVDGTAPPGLAPWPLGAATDPAVSRVAAAQWLAPILAPGTLEQRAALECWLRQHGSWDRSARALGVHRNTVRRLVGEAQHLLGRDLDDPLERARVLLALTALEAEPIPGLPPGIRAPGSTPGGPKPEPLGD